MISIDFIRFMGYIVARYEIIIVKTGINKNAFSVEYISKIPKNSSGKTIYSLLKITDED